MKISAKYLAAALAAALPLTAFAQTSDAAYCQSLAQKYQVYVSNMAVGRSPGSGTIDGTVAIEQCKAGNAAAASPSSSRSCVTPRSTCRHAGRVRCAASSVAC